MTVKNNDAPLKTIRRAKNGCCYKWSKCLVGENHLFSYYSMKECLDNEMYIYMHDQPERNNGWEIFIISKIHRIQCILL